MRAYRGYKTKFATEGILLAKTSRTSQNELCAIGRVGVVSGAVLYSTA